MKIKVKQMNGRDFEVDLHNDTPTVADLLEAIATILGITQERERLIHAGRVLVDSNTLESEGVMDGSVVHLVVRPENMPITSTPSEPAPSQPTTSTGVSTTSDTRPAILERVPVMQFQNLGNGVTVGRFTVDSGDMTESVSDVGNLVTQIFSSVIPQAIQGLSDAQSDRSNIGTTTTNTVEPQQQSQQQSQQQQTDQQQEQQQQQQHQQSFPVNSSQQVAQDIFLADSHLQALRQAQSHPIPAHNIPQSSLVPLLDSLATSLHSATLPVMQLSQGLQQVANPHQASNSANIQAQIYRVQDMLRHLSEATGHLASALQHTQVATPQINAPPHPFASQFPISQMFIPGMSSHVQFHQNIPQNQQQQQQQQSEPLAHVPPVTTLGGNTQQPTPSPSPDTSSTSGISPHVRIIGASGTISVGNESTERRNPGIVRIMTIPHATVPLVSSTQLEHSSQQNQAQVQNHNTGIEPQNQNQSANQSAATTTPSANPQSSPSSTSSASMSSQPSPASTIRASVQAENRRGPQTSTTSSFSTSASSTSSLPSNSVINPALQNLMGSVLNGVFPASAHVGTGHVASQIPHFIQAAMQLVPPVTPTSPAVHVATNSSISDTSGGIMDNDSGARSNHGNSTDVENTRHGVDEDSQTSSNSNNDTADVVDDCLADFEFD